MAKSHLRLALVHAAQDRRRGGGLRRSSEVIDIMFDFYCVKWRNWKRVGGSGLKWPKFNPLEMFSVAVSQPTRQDVVALNFRDVAPRTALAVLAGSGHWKLR
jgi:hypothetical protein